ncbi:hypothetical protein QBC32DRAFT_317585 [Pseudoneurospora amorphoporcata]|uniref:Uncharacterized protein n=1 Tax=Pseudoneurospora amorphoporcata TaxID=241081 RepID=A0AAN6SD03_9PEZI|nr:hypothetical protein QBC32DRAFT_317585 [Pseudoneurospora amorphoporcata]
MAAIPAPLAIKKEKIKENTAESALKPLPALEPPFAVTTPTSKIDPKTSYYTVPTPMKALVASRAKSKVGITSTAALLFKTKSPAPYEPYIRVNSRRVSTGKSRPQYHYYHKSAYELDPTDIKALNAATFNFICEKEHL